MSAVPAVRVPQHAQWSPGDQRDYCLGSFYGFELEEKSASRAPKPQKRKQTPNSLTPDTSGSNLIWRSVYCLEARPVRCPAQTPLCWWVLWPHRSSSAFRDAPSTSRLSPKTASVPRLQHDEDEYLKKGKNVERELRQTAVLQGIIKMAGKRRKMFLSGGNVVF